MNIVNYELILPEEWTKCIKRAHNCKTERTIDTEDNNKNQTKMKRSKRAREGVELDNPKQNCSRDRAFVFSERTREGGDMQWPSTFQSRETRG